MKSIKTILISICLLAACNTQAEKLTIERMFSSPSLSGSTTRGIKFSPDGEYLTYLQGKQEDYSRLDLWQYDLKTGQQTLLFDSNDLSQGAEQLSDEEKARRERMRLSGSGIVTYSWSKDSKNILFPMLGDAFYLDVSSKKVSRLLETDTFETDIKFSPKSNYIAFIRDQNLWIKDINSNKEMAMTTDGGGPVKNGMAEFVAQEEMGRMTGYWWSPDESKIAFLRVDESPVEEVTRSEIYADSIKMIKQRYPYAGTANVQIKLGIVDIKTSAIEWVDLGKEQDIYIPRVKWTEDPRYLSYQWQNRAQTELKLKLYDTKKKRAKTLITEKSKTWINLHDDLYFLSDKKHFIWASERDGYKHLYLYNMNGKRKKQITSGKWVVDKVSYIDQKNKQVYFVGRKDTPLEKHLYRASWSKSATKIISQRKGTHAITFSNKGDVYIDHFSTINTPPQISLHNTDGEHQFWINQNQVSSEHPLYPYVSDWIKPEFGTLKSRDGAELYYRKYLPSNFDPKQQYPAIVYLYGGPHAQMVKNSWGGMLGQYLAQKGYVVFTLDNRGSNYRGKAFEDPLHLKMGDIEVQDQVDGVKYLHKLPYIDKERIGVHGHSYGGYMTLMTMFKAGEYFKVGVSGAPVTDWALYDTHYTERYMGHPKTNAAGYQKASVFPYATNLKGPLLIYHGMADDNVLFKNSTKLYKLLQDNAIPFYVMDYPGKKHSIRGSKTQMHRYKTIQNFFDLQFGVKR
jgi:dipeptidyl-peptidase 4